MSDWKTGTPDVPKGRVRTFIVAVRRDDGNVYVFPACYLNAMPLVFDDERPVEADGEDEGMTLTTGWHQERDHADFDTAYYALFDSDNSGEVVGWQPLPKWREPHREDSSHG